MFKKKKKVNQAATGTSGTSTVTVEQTSRFSSESTTRSEIRISRSSTSTVNGISSSASNFSFDTFSNDLRNKLNIHEADGRLPLLTSPNAVKSTFSESGYQSPFSRKLKPYMSTDAKPFNASSTSSNRPLNQPSVFTHNQPLYSSFHSVPSTPLALTTFSSTHSLPTSSELVRNRDAQVPTYDTNGKKRGKVLVINNINFLEKNEERRGQNWMRKISAMLEKLKKYRNDSSLKHTDMSIVIMMSHGSNVDDTGKVIQGGFTQIYGIDSKGLPIEEVLNLFSAESCKPLAGKPKNFYISVGENSETLHRDALPTTIQSVVKKHADMLIAYSTLPGFYSLRDSQEGSWYIQCICDVFKKHAKDYDIELLLKMVDRELSTKHPSYQQTSTYESRGFKCCYLNPKF
ncbi:hypothetical protein NQ317_001062 [Molorchus minor]|uniref:Uncharacterized protein n=1 Tax=Molorchus minor TaxID=1323400 RepID=A0ABQ9JTF9_9CUCU|nr:hypothetical protein NQ317_001062 [Molorchus minor]